MITIFDNIGQLLLMSGDMASPDDYGESLLGLIEEAVLVISGKNVIWYGRKGELPSKFNSCKRIDVKGALVMPGLVDCHTHLVYGGDRALEYEMRCAGASYLDIAKRGGGIKSTVAETRRASFADLLKGAKSRAQRMMESGVSTIEIKSGYGLDLETERRQLEVAGELAKHLPQRIFRTFLGAHDVPADVERQDYIEFLVNRALPEIRSANLAEFCDIFCDVGFFTVDESRVILSKAKELGFKLKIHADELEFSGGAALAAELQAASADHLIYLDEESIKEMIERKVTFVLLPSTTCFLGKDRYAPARSIIKGRGRIALATDCNPGSSPTDNIWLITTLACSLLKITPAEALWAVTRGGAFALDKGNELGQLKLHGPADIAIFDVKKYQDLPYLFGRNVLKSLYIAGECVVDRSDTGYDT